MDKIIRASNLQKALEDYDALKGQPVLYVNELPVSPNIRTRVYCKQTTSSIDESLVITIEELVERYAEETTEGHYVIPVTHVVTFSGETVRSIVIDNGSVTVYEDDAFTTETSASFNLEGKYLFEITNYVTEMEYYMGNGANQELSPVVSFAVIADLQSKIDGNYNTLDNKIDNEISSLAVDFTTDNLVANVATINNATVNNAVIDNAQVNNFDVSTIIINGSTGNDGELVGKVNGKLEWFSSDIDTNDFKVNYLTVNNDATVNGDNFKHKGFDVTSMSVIDESDYNNLGSLERLSSFYLTGPNGNTYIHGIKFIPQDFNKYSVANNVEITRGSIPSTVSTHSLSFVSGDVVNSNATFDATMVTEALGNWTINLGVNATGSTVITNADEFYLSGIDNLYSGCSSLTDTFILNNQLISNAPAGLNFLRYSNNMSRTFANCSSLNRAISIPDGITNMVETFADCTSLNSSVVVSDSVTNMTRSFVNCGALDATVHVGNNVVDMTETFKDCHNFNKAVSIPDSVTNIDNIFRNCTSLNSEVVIGNGITDTSKIFDSCSAFNAPVTIPNSVTNMAGMFSYCPLYDKPVTIPDSVTNIDNIFNNCTRLNSAITIGNGVTNVGNILNGCTSFNSGIVTGSNVTDVSKLLVGCSSFNAPITIGSSVTNMAGMFTYCPSFSKPVTIPDNVTNASKLFNGLSSFNAPVVIGNGVTNIRNMLTGCTSFNSNITIGGNNVSAADLFRDCPSFDSNVTIRKGVENVTNLFRPCNNFNQPVHFPSSILYASSVFYNLQLFNSSVTFNDRDDTRVWYLNHTFANCAIFNKPVTIPTGVYMQNTFYNCVNFNSPVNLPNGILQFQAVFDGCTNFNQPITLPEKIFGSCAFAFNHCTNFNQPVTIPNTYSIACMFYGVKGFGGTTLNIPNTLMEGQYAFASVEDGECTINIADDSFSKIMYANCMFDDFKGHFTGNAVILGPNTREIKSMFYGCPNFNLPVTIPGSVEVISDYEDKFGFVYGPFTRCSNFNSVVTIENGVSDFRGMFEDCIIFNKPISIPSSAKNMMRTFNNCTVFNQSVNIPEGVTDLDNTFLNCTKLASSSVPIHISHTIAKGNTSNYIYNMLVNGGCGITFAASRILNDL